MTWGDLKAAIDAELAKQGGGNSTEVWYIDVIDPEQNTIITGISDIDGLRVTDSYT